MTKVREIGKTRETDADIIRMLETALEKAKRGEILNAGIVIRSIDNTYGSEFHGVSSSLQNAAQCFEIGIRMLGFASVGGSK